MQWFSGRLLKLGLRSLQPQWRHSIVPLSKILYPLLSTSLTQETCQHDWKIVDWDVKIGLKQIKPDRATFPDVYFSFTNNITFWFPWEYHSQLFHKSFKQSMEQWYRYMYFSCTPDWDFCCFYPYEISHIPIPALGKDKKMNSRTSAPHRSVTSLQW